MKLTLGSKITIVSLCLLLGLLPPACNIAADGTIGGGNMTLTNNITGPQGPQGETGAAGAAGNFTGTFNGNTTFNGTANFTNDGTSPNRIFLYSSNDSAVTFRSPTVVAGQNLGELSFHGNSTNGWAHIAVYATDTWNATSHPTEIRFGVTRTGTISENFSMILKDTGNLVLSSLNVTGTPIFVDRYSSATQGTTNNSELQLAFNTDFSGAANGITVAAANNSFTIVTPGIYNIGASVGFASNNNGRRRVLIYKNGVNIAGQNVPATNNSATILNTFTTIYCTTGDAITIRALQDSGGALNVLNGDRLLAGFWIYKVN